MKQDRSKENFSQDAAFGAMFTPGQSICFQKVKNDSSPTFLQYPFYKSPDGAQFMVLNPFKPGSTSRNQADVESRQGITTEFDCLTPTLQRAIFAGTIGNATVSNFSGGKSVHHHIIFEKPLTPEQEQELVALFKKAFPFADWTLFGDRSRLCRVPGAIRDNGKVQTIESIGTRFNAETLFAQLREKTKDITGLADVANRFVSELGKYETKDEIENGTKKGKNLPSIWQALKSLLGSGYTLDKETWEYKSLAEIFEIHKELFAMSLDATIEQAKMRLAEMVEQEQEARLAKLASPKVKPAGTGKDKWQFRATAALQGQWQSFYEQHGISGFRPASGKPGWLKGFPDGKHKNKAPGFAFDPQTGFFYDHYQGKKGFPQDFLQEYAGMATDAAWQFIAELAHVEQRDYVECRHCHKGELFWENRRLCEKNGEPHICEAKKKAQEQARFEKRKQKATAGNPNLEGVKIIKEVPTDKNDIFLVTDRGIFYQTTETNPLLGESFTVIELVCHDPVILAERLQQVDDDKTASVKLAWGEHSATVPMSYLQPKNYDKLSDLGIRIITSQKSKLLAEYFQAALGCVDIPQKALYKRAGWRGREIVLGNLAIGTTGERSICMDDDAPAVGGHGNHETWQKTVARFTNDPQAQIAIGASTIAPFLRELSVENCTIHFWCDSSAGKSFLAKLAASVWGKFDDEAGKGLLRSWNSTYVGHEFYFHQMNNLPSFLDESQLCPTPDIIEKTVYQFGNGQGKTRGTKSGCVDTLRTWRSFLLSTGEKQITEVSNRAGLAARCIELYREKHETITETEFRETNIALAENCGTAGKIIANYYLQNKDAVQAMFLATLKELEKLPTIQALNQQNDLTKRHLPRWAAILTGAQINKRLFGFQFDAKAVMTQIKKSLGEIQEKPTAAIGNILEEIYLSNKEHFNERIPGGTFKKKTGSDDLIAHGEVFGFYDVAKDTIFFFTQVLTRELEKRGYCKSQLAKLVKDGRLQTGKVEKYLGKAARFYAYSPEPEKEQQATAPALAEQKEQQNECEKALG